VVYFYTNDQGSLVISYSYVHKTAILEPLSAMISRWTALRSRVKIWPW